MFFNNLSATAVGSNARVWVASVHNVDDQSVNLPFGLQTERLTVPLRSAPVIVREVQPAIGKLGYTLPYDDLHCSGIASPADGMKIIRLSHRGRSHQGQWPVDCAQCGVDVADILDKLHVGKAGRFLEGA